MSGATSSVAGYVSALLLVAWALGASEGRDPQVFAVSDTAVLAGTVIATDAVPIRRVVVTITAPEVRDARSAVTGDDGRFRFEHLPPGHFTLTVSKPAFVTTTYGARREGGPGMPVALVAGQRVDDLRLTLPHGAAISGSVHDQNGRPLPNARIVVFATDQVEFTGGAARSIDDVVTDDRGAYRVASLHAGTYLVAAVPPDVSAKPEVEMPSAGEIDATFARLSQRQTTTPITAAGAQVSRAAPSPVPGLYGYAPIFFPSTPLASAASPVGVDAGQEREGVDIVLTPVPMAAVEGKVVRASGDRIDGATVSFLQDDRPVPPALQPRQVPFTSTASDGRFRFVAGPGHYDVEARTVDVSEQSSVAGTRRVVSHDVSPRTWWGHLEVDVSGSDISGLIVTLEPGLTLTGRVVFDGSTAATPPNMSRLDITVSPLFQRTSSERASAIVQADGTFLVSGLVPGRYQFRVGAVAGGSRWWPRSALVDGQDVLDVPLEIRPGTNGPVLLTLSDRHAGLAGTLRTLSGQPAAPYAVVVFPVDRALWSASRRVQSSRTATDGTFVFRELPPGAYRAAAVANVDTADLQSPAFLDTLVAASIVITIVEGEQRVQNLQIAR